MSDYPYVTIVDQATTTKKRVHIQMTPDRALDMMKALKGVSDQDDLMYISFTAESVNLEHASCQQ